MSKAQVGKIAPNFKLTATGNKDIELKSLRRKMVVLYFYPKDNTPGCTAEGQDFAAQYAKFKRKNAVVLGISRDTVTSHEKFKKKFNFPFIIAVSGKNKSEILDNFRKRIKNDKNTEFKEATRQVKKIASLRLKQINNY